MRHSSSSSNTGDLFGGKVGRQQHGSKWLEIKGSVEGIASSTDGPESQCNTTTAPEVPASAPNSALWIKEISSIGVCPSNQCSITAPVMPGVQVPLSGHNRAVAGKHGKRFDSQ